MFLNDVACCSLTHSSGHYASMVLDKESPFYKLS